jgi:chemotaxis protein CheZ
MAVQAEDPRLSIARSLVRSLENGDSAGADDYLRALVRDQEVSLFNEVGRLTRQLHDSLMAVELDGRIQEIAENAIPDAHQRLAFVVEKTEEAANRTLNAVEELLPLSERMGHDASRLIEDWSRFKRREMSVEEFRALLDTELEFLGGMQGSARAMHDKLSEVLMAQDFQDLTGQVIRRVMTLVKEVQDSLVNMIRITGAGRPDRVYSNGTGTHAEGPQVGLAAESANVVNGQDEVDDLLSSLGF